MQLQQLRAFLGVVDGGGVAAAARMLRVTASTVSQAIRDLERELDAVLFDRLGRGLALSAAGRALVGPARRVLRDVAIAEGALALAAGRIEGALAIAAPSALAADPVAGLVCEFLAAHPGVTVRVDDLDAVESVTASLHHGHHDLVISYVPDPRATGLDILVMGRATHHLVYPAGTVLPPEDPLPLAELPDVPLVVVPRGNPRAAEVERIVAKVGSVPAAAAVVDGLQARLSFVIAGVGGSFLPPGSVADARALGLPVRRTEPEITWTYGLVYEESGLSPVARAFLDMVRSSRRGDGQEGVGCG